MNIFEENFHVSSWFFFKSNNLYISTDYITVSPLFPTQVDLYFHERERENLL